MVQTRFSRLIAILLPWLFAPLALSIGVPPGCDRGTFMAEAGANGSTYYVDARSGTEGVWLYQESNGIFVGNDVALDLQVGGASAYVPGDADPCGTPGVPPDTLIV
jgi:hypothetical protein